MATTIIKFDFKSAFEEVLEKARQVGLAAEHVLTKCGDPWTPYALGRIG
jgi:hypothetical protein